MLFRSNLTQTVEMVVIYVYSHASITVSIAACSGLQEFLVCLCVFMNIWGDKCSRHSWFAVCL